MSLWQLWEHRTHHLGVAREYASYLNTSFESLSQTSEARQEEGGVSDLSSVTPI